MTNRVRTGTRGTLKMASSNGGRMANCHSLSCRQDWISLRNRTSNRKRRVGFIFLKWTHTGVETHSCTLSSLFLTTRLSTRAVLLVLKRASQRCARSRSLDLEATQGQPIGGSTGTSLCVEYGDLVGVSLDKSLVIQVDGAPVGAMNPT